MAMGMAPSSEIAQRFANALMQSFCCRLDKAEASADFPRSGLSLPPTWSVRGAFASGNLCTVPYHVGSPLYSPIAVHI